jgi:hypothetical protein
VFKLIQGGAVERTGIRLATAMVVLSFLVGCELEEDHPPDLTGPSGVSNPTGDPNAVLGSVPDAPAPSPSPDTETPELPPETPPPTPGSCSLPPSNPTNPTCTSESPLLLAEVEAALDAVTARFPELFDFGDTKCDNCYFVEDPSRYVDEVIRQLNRQGLCTDGVREELGIKSSNDFSEQYDIILASGHMRRGVSAYRGVCRPAIF